MKTPQSAIFLGVSPTDATLTPEITKRLNAAEPTIDCGPSSEGVSSSLVTVSSTESKISGAEDPRAISVRFAMVGFQTGFSTSTILPSLSTILTMVTLEVITSMASIKMSATMAIPKKRYKRIKM